MARSYTWDFPDVKFRVAAQLAGSLGKAAKFRSLYDIGESNPVPAFGLWSGSSSKVNQFVHVPTSVDTRNISSKSMHAFLSNLANRQTDRQPNTGKTCTSYFVWGKIVQHFRLLVSWSSFTYLVVRVASQSVILCIAVLFGKNLPLRDESPWAIFFTKLGNNNNNNNGIMISVFVFATGHNVAWQYTCLRRPVWSAGDIKN